MNVIEFMHEYPSYFEDFITRSTYHSNAIEGSTLSYAETYAILWNDNSLEIKATACELHEAINHKYALDFAFAKTTEALTERDIKHIAGLINKKISEVSDYRHVQVFIRGAQYIPPEANQVNRLMMQLVHEYNHSPIDNPFVREAQFHIQFERIHPFEDGNGRTGRILLNKGLAGSGKALVVIPFEQRAEYMNLLASADVDGLADMLESLSHLEADRMNAFAESKN